LSGSIQEQNSILSNLISLLNNDTLFHANRDNSNNFNKDNNDNKNDVQQNNVEGTAPPAQRRGLHVSLDVIKDEKSNNKKIITKNKQINISNNEITKNNSIINLLSTRLDDNLPKEHDFDNINFC